MFPKARSGNRFVLGQHRIYMLPTRYGWYFSGVLLVSLLASMNYNNGMGYGLTFLLAATAFLSMITTHRNLKGLVIETGHSLPVFAGQTARFIIHVTNPDTRIRPAIESRHGKRLLETVDIPAQSTAFITLSAPATRRGYLDAPSFHVVTRFPFALLYTWSREMLPSIRCLVYPAPAPLPPAEYATPGDAESQHHNRQGDEFNGLRDYQAGDSFSRIHWRASAKSPDSVYVVQTATGDINKLWLDWDLVNGDTETRLSLLCRAVIDAQRQNQSYGLKIPGTVITPGTGQHHQHECLRALACFSEK
ncbi:MAG: DUF58 domain-containing protein [Gammaproteobacteria bacterium]|nr:DUF58 domain-containing protein [Gammaproteobacteria bacterium]